MKGIPVSKKKFASRIKEDEKLAYFEDQIPDGETYSEEGEDAEMLADDETLSNELNGGQSETSQELKDEKMNANNSPVAPHDEGSDDEYTIPIAELTNEELETSIDPKRLKLAFAKAKLSKGRMSL